MKYFNYGVAGYHFKNNLIILLLIIIYPYVVSSQNFERAYGSIYEDNAQFVIPAFDGGYLMAGYTLNATSSPGNSYDILLVKTDSSGNTLWSKTIGGTADDLSYWIEQATDSTYLICGNTFDNTTNTLDDFIIRIDLTGSIIFQKIYTFSHGERAFCIRQANDGGFVVAGETLIGGVDLQMNLFKTDTSGNIQWSKAFGDSEQESSTYVKQTNDNGYILCGVSRFGLTWSSIYIVKTDSSGNLQWSKKYNTQPYLSRCDVSRVLETADGGFIVSGTTSANQPLKSIVLMKIDSTGSVLWQSLYSSGRGERNSDIIQDVNGYTLCGSTATTSGYDDLLIMNTDIAGNLLWNYSYGVEDSNTFASSMVKSNDGTFIIAGTTDAYGAGDGDFFLMKFDSSAAASLCNLKTPEIMQDTITLIGTSVYDSSSVNTISLNSTFSAAAGIQETPICSQSVNIPSYNQFLQFEIAPNPFSENISITVKTVEQTSDASIVIYDLFGRKIKSINDNSSSQDHQFRFCVNDTDIPLKNGVYYFTFSAGKNVLSKKIVFND